MFYPEASLKSLLRCPFCKQNATSPPRVLKCGNTICEPCLKSFVENKDLESINCPLCGDLHELQRIFGRDALQNFPVNRLLARLLELQPVKVHKSDDFGDWERELSDLDLAIKDFGDSQNQRKLQVCEYDDFLRQETIISEESAQQDLQVAFDQFSNDKDALNAEELAAIDDKLVKIEGEVELFGLVKSDDQRSSVHTYERAISKMFMLYESIKGLEKLFDTDADQSEFETLVFGMKQDVLGNLKLRPFISNHMLDLASCQNALPETKKITLPDRERKIWATNVLPNDKMVILQDPGLLMVATVDSDVKVTIGQTFNFPRHLPASASAILASSSRDVFVILSNGLKTRVVRLDHNLSQLLASDPNMLPNYPVLVRSNDLDSQCLCLLGHKSPFVTILDSNLEIVSIWDTVGLTESDMTNLTAAAIKDGVLYVLLRFRQVLVKYSLTGQHLATYKDEFWKSCENVLVDSMHRLVVIMNKQVAICDRNGIVISKHSIKANNSGMNATISKHGRLTFYDKSSITVL